MLGWYLCRYEHAGAWIALMKRIAEPRMVVSDGGTGFAKALKKAWPKAKHQRCVFHVFCQVKRYITSRPNTAAGAELYMLVKDLLKIKSPIDLSLTSLILLNIGTLAISMLMMLGPSYLITQISPARSIRFE